MYIRNLEKVIWFSTLKTQILEYAYYAFFFYRGLSGSAGNIKLK